jgi:hypothetical protein
VEGESVEFSAKVTAKDMFTLNYLWDFGDGSTNIGIEVSHQFLKPGKYKVTLKVTDKKGRNVFKSVIINVEDIIKKEKKFATIEVRKKFVDAIDKLRLVNLKSKRLKIDYGYFKESADIYGINQINELLVEFNRIGAIGFRGGEYFPKNDPWEKVSLEIEIKDDFDDIAREIREKFNKTKKYSAKELPDGIEKEEERKMKMEKGNTYNIHVKNVAIIGDVGDGSSINIIQNEVNDKLDNLIAEIEKHNIPEKEEIIKQLKDEKVRKDKTKLREVIGNIISKAAQFGSIASGAASILKLLQ